MTPAFHRCAALTTSGYRVGRRGYLGTGHSAYRVSGRLRLIVSVRSHAPRFVAAPVRRWVPGYPICPDCYGAREIAGATCAYCDGFGRVGPTYPMLGG